ncbi:Hypothetical protein SMAX5B_020980 [Scophthalmus maximus]|uniref:TNF family profile domain-containing protein n=1 Tax=Scophthalmus maximus TaxID=52904 RepID=A0A2U9CX41_SCOMX|nr:Hypothetical protein SMAX5B_020980 [Scophthalmus maximus]
MPQHTRHSLINVLLLWTAILSIVQVVFIVFYITAGHRGVPPSEHGLLLGKGKMLSFLATDGTEAHDDDKRIRWLAKNPDATLISEGDVLAVKKDGYYFLNLQVTLRSCEEEKEHTVSLKWNNKLLLHGWINTKSCSTGLLGKVEELSAGGTLGVTLEPKTSINTSESETHLDIIYMRKP